MASSAKRWVRWWRTKVKAHVLGLWGSPSARGNRACKRRKASSVTRHGRHRTSPALHVTRKTRSRRLAVAPLHHGAPRCDRCYHPETNAWKLVRTGINGCSAMAHPLTHLTHGISTRRRFHPRQNGPRASTPVWGSSGESRLISCRLHEVSQGPMPPRVDNGGASHSPAKSFR